MALTLTEWLAMAQVGALGISVMLNLWLYFAVRSDSRWKAMFEAISQGDGQLAAELARIDRHHGATQSVIDRRLSVLETRVEAMPTHDDLTEILGQLSRIDRTLAGVGERSETTQESVRRIERYLLEKSR